MAHAEILQDLFFAAFEADANEKDSTAPPYIDDFTVEVTEEVVCAS
jgi:hypothetical protein